MKLTSRIRHISYKPLVVRLIQFLRIRALMRKLYFTLARPRNNIKRIFFEGINAQFLVNTPQELRLVETPFERGMGNEQDLLKELISSLNPGDVGFDIGASIGIHTVFMAKKAGEKGRIIALEPESSSFASLKANIRLNTLGNVTPLQIALGNDFSEGILSTHGTTGDFSLVERQNNDTASKVNIVPGDFLIQRKKLPLPNIVKVDVEGYEYSVIQGLKRTLSQRECRALCCEVHPNLLPEGITNSKILDLLKSFGFRRIESSVRGETIHAFYYKY